MQRPHEERRRTGISVVKLSDGNGGHDRRVVINASAWKTWIGLILAIAALGAVAQQAFTAGVRHEINTFCDSATAPPSGKLYRTMDSMANSHVVAIEKNLDKRFDSIEKDISQIQTEIATAKDERNRQHQEIMRILTNR